MPPITRPKVSTIKERGVREHASPVESLGTSITSATRIIKTYWSERFRAARAYLGYSKLERDGNNAIVGLRRLNPVPHPDYVKVENDRPGLLYASRVSSIKPWRVSGSMAVPSQELAVVMTGGTASRTDFHYAELNIEYENLGHEIREDTDPEVEWPRKEWKRHLKYLGCTVTTEYITMPGGTLMYAKNGGGGPTGKTIGYNTGKVFPKQQHRYLWKRLPYELFTPLGGIWTNWQKRIWGDPDNASVIPYIGCVNKGRFLNFPEGTILLESVTPIPVEDMFGNVYEWDFEIVVTFDPWGWNYKYYWPAATENEADRGSYLVSSNGTYYAANLIPDHKSLYNIRVLENIFDVRDTLPGTFQP